MLIKLLLLMVATVVFAACENPVKKAARNAGYAAYEMVGVQKRDLLKNRINETREEQKEAGEQFADSLEKLQKLYGLEGDKLEAQYKKVKSSFQESKEQVQEVKNARLKWRRWPATYFESGSKRLNKFNRPTSKAVAPLSSVLHGLNSMS